jgi:hypothetical protein
MLMGLVFQSFNCQIVLYVKGLLPKAKGKGFKQNPSCWKYSTSPLSAVTENLP